MIYGSCCNKIFVFIYSLGAALPTARTNVSRARGGNAGLRGPVLRSASTTTDLATSRPTDTTTNRTTDTAANQSARRRVTSVPDVRRRLAQDGGTSRANIRGPLLATGHPLRIWGGKCIYVFVKINNYKKVFNFFFFFFLSVSII